MVGQRRFLWKFFVMHFCMIIPILLASIFIACTVSDRMDKMETEAMVRQMENAKMKFYDSYVIYFDESVLLSSRTELLKHKMLSNAMDAYDGIELLREKQSFDDRISAIFMEYGNDYVYSSSGIFRKTVYFGSMGYRQESIQRALDIIESHQSAVTFLFRTEDTGNMLFSYFTTRSEKDGSSVNYIVSFEQVKGFFYPIYDGQWYWLEATDGSSLGLGCDADGNIVVLTQAECEERAFSKEYQVLEEKLEDSELIIKLYYKKASFNLHEGFYQVQLINMLLIGIGGIGSAVLSWLLSKRRMKEIKHLESISRGAQTYLFSEKNAYSQVQNIILGGLNKTKELEKKTKEYAKKLRNKNTYMILHGLLYTKDDIKRAFQEMDFKNCPQYFFVGAVSSDKEILDSKLTDMFQGCLIYQTVHKDQDVVVFLKEVMAEDESKVQRKKYAEGIRAYLHQQGIRRVRVGMSRVYMDCLMADCAYSEAISVLEYVIFGKIRDFCGCWEDVMHENQFLLPDDTDIQRFSEALEQSDLELAKKWLGHICGSVDKECTQENRIYIRYMVLQCLVSHLRGQSGTENSFLLSRCLNLNLQNEKEFAQEMNNILKSCLNRKQEDSFIKMLKFIENNYCQSNLSYEDVASVGGVSKTYISKMFRSKFGMSYIEYITQVRMEKACTLLRTTDININDIVSMVGYENASSFRRSFKDKYGMSAAEYRKKNKEIGEYF